MEITLAHPVLNFNPPPPAYGKYDLVSHGKNTVGKNECWGTYNSTTQAGYGPAYENPCVHSGIIKTSSDISTVWYNFMLATAGTIMDINTSSSSPATNMTKATESVCPKGWTLPNLTQIAGNRNVASFSPVFGGGYSGSTLVNESTVGYWWGSEAVNGTMRYYLRYNSNGNYLSTGTDNRFVGFYVRCVQKPAPAPAP